MVPTLLDGSHGNERHGGLAVQENPEHCHSGVRQQSNVLVARPKVRRSAARRLRASGIPREIYNTAELGRQPVAGRPPFQVAPQSGKDVGDSDPAGLDSIDDYRNMLAGREVLSRMVTIGVRHHVHLDLAVDNVPEATMAS